ncbi:hypothetical protein MIMGU_mgv1a021785mg [Erythranthe guttata]|uniref:3'-5' exonuclease domain-containing protein n=1 Tax=Erythranthe guttata TaxID=4155 RepID=A0A022S0F3_ERYGU|nr:hypothetical protein MIMGU_mgv1a021785mg [Erythranthe guttata]
MPNLLLFPFENTILNVTIWISSVCRIHTHVRSAKIIAGLDTEWLPNLGPQEDHPIAVLQLCVGHDCLVFQILRSDFIPKSLQVFLADPRHTFCGVGIKDDVDKLYDHHGLRVGRIADLNDLARMSKKMTDGQDRNYRYMGLKKMALALLGKKMEKPLNVTLSKWDAEELDSAQIQYAAIDAAVSFELGFMLWRNQNSNSCKK